MRLFLLSIVLFSLTSCQTGKTGHLKIDRAVSADFASCTVYPQYNYYYSGPNAQPNAILAVKKEYNFEQGLWKPIDLTREQLCDWIRIIDPEYRQVRNGYSYDGYMIFSADKKELGLWYSRENHAVIKEQADKLIIYTPSDRPNSINNFNDINSRF